MSFLPFIKNQQEFLTYLGWRQREEEEGTGGRINHPKEHQGNMLRHGIPETKRHLILGPDRRKM